MEPADGVTLHSGLLSELIIFPTDQLLTRNAKYVASIDVTQFSITYILSTIQV